MAKHSREQVVPTATSSKDSHHHSKTSKEQVVPNITLSANTHPTEQISNVHNNLIMNWYRKNLKRKK